MPIDEQQFQEYIQAREKRKKQNLENYHKRKQISI